ncbi:MAG: right-handed parallel beta-helix repeat-containing protein [Bacteroidales bacterium]
MHKLFTFLILVSILFSSCRNDSPVKTKDYYLNNQTGNDRNRGTLRKPIKTITELNARLASKPGNIYFTSGQTFEGTLVLTGVIGTDSLPVLITSTGEGRATVNGGDCESFRIKNCENIRISNLDLTGAGREEGNNTNGIQMVNCENCTIEDLNAVGFQKSGVDLYNCRNSEVRNVTAYGNGFCGIHIMGSSQDSSASILIKDCNAENNAGDPTILDNHSGNGILVGVSRNVTIDHCTATNNGWDMPRQGNGPVGIWAWMSDHVTIQYCISYRNRTSKGGKDGGGFDLDGGVTNSLIQYCLSYENEGAGYGLFQYPGAANWANNVIRYCVSINDARTTEGAGSFFIWNGSGESSQLTDCYIYNNVVYSESAPAISYESASEHGNFLFCNNIFIVNDLRIRGKNKGSSFTANVWGSVTDPVLEGPFDTDLADPCRLNTLTGLMLPRGSKLKDSGIQIQSMYGFDPPLKDFFGFPVPSGSAPDPGIHELD